MLNYRHTLRRETNSIEPVPERYCRNLQLNGHEAHKSHAFLFVLFNALLGILERQKKTKMKNVPTHLTHKPIVAVDYEHIDNSAGASDAKSLSVGEATWNKKYGKEKDLAYSAKIFRQLWSSGNWSRQSEELPLWRVIDLATLVIAVINDKPSGMGDIVVSPDKYAKLREFIRQNGTMYQQKIANLKKVL